jgi:sugar lactone lactonase YvrE
MLGKKRMIAAASIACCLVMSTGAGYAAESVKSDMKLLIGGKDAAFAAQSMLVDSSLYAPYDAVAKQLGAEAKWNADTKTLTLHKDGVQLELKADSPKYLANGLELSTSAALQSAGGAVLVPVRLVFEHFGYKIGYEAATRTVSVTAGSADKPSFQVLGVVQDGYVMGTDLNISVLAYNHILKDFAVAKEAKAGEGHIHLWLDASSLDASTAVKAFKNEPVVFKDLKPGEHTLTIQLVGNDHKPVTPEVKQTIKFQTAKLSILADLDTEKATGMRVEGVIANDQGNVFAADSDSRKLFRIKAGSGKVEELTVLPRAATGMAFDAEGNLYLASGGMEGVILKINEQYVNGKPFEPSLVETYVTGTMGANGLTFDSKGNLYVSGGANGNIYKATPDGELTTYKSGIQPGRTTQMITVNGVAFGKDGKLYVANTSSGEVNRFTMNEDGSLGAVERVAQDPLLYGADGLNFGPDGAVYVAANERNSIVRVSTDGKVTEVAHNGNTGPLEFPASLHFVGNTLFISNFDQPRGDNMPNDAGIGASIATIEFGPTK